MTISNHRPTETQCHNFYCYFNRFWAVFGPYLKNFISYSPQIIHTISSNRCLLIGIIVRNKILQEFAKISLEKMLPFGTELFGVTHWHNHILYCFFWVFILRPDSTKKMHSNRKIYSAPVFCVYFRKDAGQYLRPFSERSRRADFESVIIFYKWSLFFEFCSI